MRQGPLDLPRLELLRRQFGERARWLMTQAELRRLARTKFSRAESLFFEREALEQASSEALAEHRAERLDRLAPPGPVLDLGCGIGGDLLALAARREVVAYERDPHRAELARANLRALGLNATVHTGEFPTDLKAAAAFCDPARRRNGRRLLDPEQGDPPLSSLRALRVGLLAVKVAPGLESVPEGLGMELVGLPGECREAVLWSDCPGRRWGSFLDDRGWLELTSGPDPEATGRLDPGAYLYDPEPTAVRARALGSLAEELEARPFDPQVAYLVGPHARQHRLAACFELLEVLPFSLKRVQAAVRAAGWSRLEIKKRGHALTPEELRRKLRLADSGGEGTLILTRQGDRPLALLARRIR
ncbi:MAG: methyltransferase [Candidatus Xenobia bacterium]